MLIECRFLSRFGLLLSRVSSSAASKLGGIRIRFELLAFGGSALASLHIIVDELVVLIVYNLVLLFSNDVHSG